MHACPISLSGMAVTNCASTPKLASETATLHSPPPYVTSNSRACVKRSRRMVAKRSIISPNVTTDGMYLLLLLLRPLSDRLL